MNTSAVLLGFQPLSRAVPLILSFVILSSGLEYGSQAFAQQPPAWAQNPTPWGNHTVSSGLKPCFPPGGHWHRGHLGHRGNQTGLGTHQYGVNGTWMGNATRHFGQYGNHTGFGIVPCPAVLANPGGVTPAGGNQSAAPAPTSAKIPGWVRNNAKWWSEGQMGDSDFAQGIQFLIQKGIIKIPPTQVNQTSASQQIPSWIKTNAKWWAQGQISDDDFIKGVQYLVSSGIVKI